MTSLFRSLVLSLVATLACPWGSACFASEYDSVVDVRLAQSTYSEQDIRRKMDAARARQRNRYASSDPARQARLDRMYKLHDSAPKLGVGETVHYGRSGNPIAREKKLTDGASNISVSLGEFDVPLYPGSPRYTSVGSSSTGKGTSKDKYMKFWTRDSVSQVYGFYVRSLKAKGWQFLKGSTASEIQAALPSKHLAVSIKYKALPQPYRGSAVAVTQAWRQSGGVPSKLITLTTLDMNERELKDWWSGH